MTKAIITLIGAFLIAFALYIYDRNVKQDTAKKNGYLDYESYILDLNSSEKLGMQLSEYKEALSFSREHNYPWRNAVAKEIYSMSLQFKDMGYSDFAKFDIDNNYSLKNNINPNYRISLLKDARSKGFESLHEYHTTILKSFGLQTNNVYEDVKSLRFGDFEKMINDGVIAVYHALDRSGNINRSMDCSETFSNKEMYGELYYVVSSGGIKKIRAVFLNPESDNEKNKSFKDARYSQLTGKASVKLQKNGEFHFYSDQDFSPSVNFYVKFGAYPLKLSKFYLGGGEHAESWNKLEAVDL